VQIITQSHSSTVSPSILSLSKKDVSKISQKIIELDICEEHTMEKDKEMGSLSG
jgi:hypothetical protein